MLASQSLAGADRHRSSRQSADASCRRSASAAGSNVGNIFAGGYWTEAIGRAVLRSDGLLAVTGRDRVAATNQAGDRA